MKAEILAALRKRFLADFAWGKMVFVLQATFSTQETFKAHEALETNQDIGKVVLQVPIDDPGD